MRKLENGMWKCAFPVSTGQHTYHFILNNGDSIENPAFLTISIDENNQFIVFDENQH
jgi:hypothetical protein